MNFDFLPYADLTIGVMIDTLNAYGDLTQTFSVDVIINTAPPGALTPDTEALLRYVWDNPSLVAAGKAELVAALESYGRDTLLRDIPGFAGDDSGPIVGVVSEENGVSSVTYTLPHSEIDITVVGNTAIISGPDFTDTLTDIDRLRFLDGTYAFDNDGPAGNLYGLYEAAFNRTPDGPGFAYWIELLDQNAIDVARAADLFIGSAEFQAIYAPLFADAEAFVSQLYKNILDRDPEAAGLIFWAEQYSNGTMDASDLLTGISVSQENLDVVAEAFANGYFY